MNMFYVKELQKQLERKLPQYTHDKIEFVNIRIRVNELELILDTLRDYIEINEQAATKE